MSIRGFKAAPLALACALSLAVSVAACGSSSSSSSTGGDSGSGGDSAQIGVAMPISGPTAALGAPVANAVKLAVKEAAKTGGLPGTLTANVGDDQEKPEVGSTLARKFCGEENTIGVIGDLSSSVTLGTQPVYNGCGLTQITPTASSDELTEKGYSQFFRTVGTNSSEAEGSVKWLFQKVPGVKTAVTIDANDSTTVDFANNFASLFEEEGGEILSQEHITSGEGDFRGVLTKIIAENPDVLQLTLFYSDSALVVKQARELGYKGQIIGIDADLTPEFVKIAGKAAAEGTLIPGLGPDPTKIPSAKSFTAAYEAAYGEPPDTYAANAYDAANVLIDAWKKVGGTDRGEIVEAVSTTEIEGIQGPIAFTSTGDLKNPTIGMFQVENGEISYVGAPE